MPVHLVERIRGSLSPCTLSQPDEITLSDDLDTPVWLETSASAVTVSRLPLPSRTFSSNPSVPPSFPPEACPTRLDNVSPSFPPSPLRLFPRPLRLAYDRPSLNSLALLDPGSSASGSAERSDSGLRSCTSDLAGTLDVLGDDPISQLKHLSRLSSRRTRSERPPSTQDLHLQQEASGMKFEEEAMDIREGGGGTFQQEKRPSFVVSFSPSHFFGCSARERLTFAVGCC